MAFEISTNALTTVTAFYYAIDVHLTSITRYWLQAFCRCQDFCAHFALRNAKAGSVASLTTPSVGNRFALVHGIAHELGGEFRAPPNLSRFGCRRLFQF